MKTVVLELGGCKIRYRVFGAGTKREGEVLNVLGRAKRPNRVLVGERLRQCPTYVMSRPSQRGVILDWELQKQILVSEIFSNLLDKLADCRLVVAVSPAVADSETLRSELLAVFFEDFRFQQVVILNSSLCAQFSPSLAFSPEDWKNPCGLIVDLGFSGFRIIPVFNTLPIPRAQIRLDLGGRVLNNFLKELLAFGAVDLDDNPLLVERIRELAATLQPGERIRLPDYVDNFEPEIVPAGPASSSGASSAAELLTLEKERGLVEAAAFCPEIAGVQQCGLAEAAEAALRRCPVELRELVVRKIVVTGGLAKTPGIVDQFARNFRSALPQEWRGFRVIMEHDDPDWTNFRGALALSESEQDLQNIGVYTRQMFFGR